MTFALAFSGICTLLNFGVCIHRLIEQSWRLPVVPFVNGILFLIIFLSL